MDVSTDRITTTDRKNVSTTPDEELVELPASEGSARERAGVDEFYFADESKSLANEPISIPKDVARTMKDISESSTMTGSIRYAVNEESYPKHDEQVLTFESSGFSIRLPYSIKEHKGELTAPMREICTYLMDGFGLTQENAEQLVRARFHPTMPIVTYLLNSTSGPQPQFPKGMELDENTLLNSIFSTSQMKEFLRSGCREFLSPLRNAIFAQNASVEQALRFGSNEVLKLRSSFTALINHVNKIMDGVRMMSHKISTNDHITNSLSAIHHRIDDAETLVQDTMQSFHSLQSRVHGLDLLVHSTMNAVEELKNSNVVTTPARMKRMEEFLEQCKQELPLSKNHTLTIIQSKIVEILDSINGLRISIRELEVLRDSLITRMDAMEKRIDEISKSNEEFKMEKEVMHKRVVALEDENNRLKRKYSQIDDILSRLSNLERGNVDSPMQLDSPEPIVSTSLPHTSTRNEHDSRDSKKTMFDSTRQLPNSDTMPSPFSTPSQSTQRPKSAFAPRDYSIPETTQLSEKERISKKDESSSSTTTTEKTKAFLPQKEESLSKSYDSVLREGEKKELPTQRLLEKTQRKWKRKEDIEEKDFWKYYVKDATNFIPDRNGEPHDIQPPKAFIRNFIWNIDGDAEILRDMTTPFTGNDPDYPPQWELPHFYFSLWMTGFHNFNWGMQSPISIRVHPTCTQDPKDLTVAGDLRRKSNFSLCVLRRIVRFTNTGFWISMKGSHDSFESLWKNCTRVLLLHQFGHFLYTCYEYQFTNVFLVYHVTEPRMTDTSLELLHVGIKFGAECTVCHKNAFWNFWGFPFHTTAQDGSISLFTHQCVSTPNALSVQGQLQPLLLFLYWTHWMYEFAMNKISRLPDILKKNKKLRNLYSWDASLSIDHIMDHYRLSTKALEAYIEHFELLEPPLPVDLDSYENIEKPTDISNALRMLNLPNVWTVPNLGQTLELTVDNIGIERDSTSEQTSSEKSGKERRSDSVPPQSRGRSSGSEWKEVGRSKSRPRESTTPTSNLTTDELYDAYVTAAFGKGKGKSKGKGKGKGKGWSGTLPSNAEQNTSTDTTTSTKRDTISSTHDSTPQRGRQEERQSNPTRSQSWASMDGSSRRSYFSSEDDEDFLFNDSTSGQPAMSTSGHNFNWKTSDREWEPEFVRNGILSTITTDSIAYARKYGFDSISIECLTPNVSSYYVPFLGLRFSTVQSLKHFWQYRCTVLSDREYVYKEWLFNSYRHYWTINGWRMKRPFLSKPTQELIHSKFEGEKSIQKEMFGAIHEEDLRKYPENLRPTHFNAMIHQLKKFHLRDFAIVGFLDMECYLDPLKKPADGNTTQLIVEVSFCLSETIALNERKMSKELMQNRYDPITHSITWHIGYSQFDENVTKYDVNATRTNRYLFENVLGISMPHATFSVWRSDRTKDTWKVITEPVLSRQVDRTTFIEEFTTVLRHMLMPFAVEHATIAYKGGESEKALLNECEWKGNTFDLEDLYCPSFDVVPGQILSMFPECGCNFHLPMNAIERKCAFGYATELSSTIEWPPMAIYVVKPNKSSWKWQHCPLREVCFLRWWTSRYYPFTMPIYPCILLTVNGFDPKLKQFYDWKLHRHHVYAFCRKLYEMKENYNPDEVENWGLDSLLPEHPMNDTLMENRFHVQDYAKFLENLKYTKKHTVHTLSTPDPNRFKDLFGERELSLKLGGIMNRRNSITFCRSSSICRSILFGIGW